MSPAFTKLRAKLSELFQLDAAAELDFGIYRILNARRGEVERFLDSLEEQVAGELRHLDDAATAGQRAELDKLVADLRGLAVEEAAIDQNKKVAELRAKLAEAPDLTSLQNDLFSHLTTFFSRYYKDGDFLSLRRYKKDTYAIPYEGEEVKLHWANSDQYYIKSTENFRDYTFRLGAPLAADKPDGRSIVTFKLVEADTQKDNTKATAGQERRFVFQGVIPSEAGNCVLGFAYLPLGKDQKQKDLNASAHQQILAYLTEEMPVAQRAAFLELAAADKTYTVKGKTRTVLEKHLTEYTAKNTFDYFIHKDLGGFLRRELDFYIKNEVIHLEDLENAPETNWQQMQARVKTLRLIAGKVIRFLAQIEDFQKKLWLKKKFVTRCDYVITLDRIPESLYPEIAACDAQREEWVRLYAIDEIQGDLGRTGYSVPLTVDFLKENLGLPVDTSLLSTQHELLVKERVSASQASIALRSENFNALNLLQAPFLASLDFIYTDPPYNTGSDDNFPYKDNFQRSTWLTLMGDRLGLARNLLNDTGTFAASMGVKEHPRIVEMLEKVFGVSNLIAELVWEKGRKNDARRFSVGHDYLIVAARNLASVEEHCPPWREPKPGVTDIIAEYRQLKMVHGSDYEAISAGLQKFYRSLSADHPSKKYSRSRFADERGVWRDNNITWPGGGGPRYEVLHPVTRQPCPVPDDGWRFIESTMKKKIDDGFVVFREDHSQPPFLKSYLYLDGGNNDDEGQPQVMGSVFYRHSQPSSDWFKNLFLGKVFENPKDHEILGRLIRYLTNKTGTTLDFFAGSGSSGHAVLDLNRMDGGNRRYILIEMGEHFDTVLVPRLKKVIYAKDWKDGKPVSRNTGISHCVCPAWAQSKWGSSPLYENQKS